MPSLISCCRDSPHPLASSRSIRLVSTSSLYLFHTSGLDVSDSIRRTASPHASDAPMTPIDTVDFPAPPLTAADSNWFRHDCLRLDVSRVVERMNPATPGAHGAFPPAGAPLSRRRPLAFSAFPAPGKLATPVRRSALRAAPGYSALRYLLNAFATTANPFLSNTVAIMSNE